MIEINTYAKTVEMLEKHRMNDDNVIHGHLLAQLNDDDDDDDNVIHVTLGIIYL